MVMYQNYWLPIKGFAALRIKRALVAEPQQRTAEDSQGNTYNLTRGNQTLVLTREKEFHQVLDSKGYRKRSLVSSNCTNSKMGSKHARVKGILAKICVSTKPFESGRNLSCP